MSVNIVDQTTGKLSPIAGSTNYASAPIGAILPFGGSSAPQGFLICDGSTVSRTSYAELFAVIGTSFGSGDGSTTFNIPDLRETVPVGAGTSDRSAITTHDAYSLGQFKDDQIQEHTHTYLHIPQDTHSDLKIPSGASYAYGNLFGYSTSTPNSGRHGDTTHGKQLGVNYIIKAINIALPSDFETAVDEKISEVVTPTLTSFTNITRTLANGQTYINENMFAVPEGTKRVFFALEGSGNIGGYVELIKGIQGYARDFNNIGEVLVAWTNANNINVSYFYNHVGVAKDYTFKCKYLA